MPAFLFTDIEGSTRLWEEYPEEMSTALAHHNEILRETVQQCRGQVVKSTGDGFLVLFETGNPLECAILMQKAMQESDWPEEIGELRIRIGIHQGYFEPRGDDIYGADVNRAARVMDAAWGGQILITDDTKIEYKLPEDASLADLGAHKLKDLNDPQPLFALVHPELRQNFPPPRSLSAQPNNLPILPTEFIGRQEEIKAIGDLLRANTCRLITLHGPGGIGKTRLSIEAGMSFLKHYPFGVYFVSLAPMDNPEDIWSAIASAVSLPLYKDESPKDQVLNYLKQKELLLVLDNFEHLQRGASLVSELLDGANQIQVLVTSRTRLQLTKECVFEVDGLQFPNKAEDEIFENFEAVQLFTNLALRSDPHFQIHNGDKEAIVEICRLMDGMPLGIELAAHWVRIISPKEIAAELREDIEFLRTEMVDVPERHRSMRAMFDYSWKLLDERERQVLKSLSIFRGGCTLTAAKEVVGSSLMTISSLVDKSLVKRNANGRYEMHELIRQLAEERLKEDHAGYQELLGKHSEYFLTQLTKLEADLKGKDQITALDHLDQDLENIRLAWQQAILKDRPELIGGALESFYWMTIYRNHHVVGQELVEHARKKWSNPEINPNLYHRLRIRYPDESADPMEIYQDAVDSARARDAKQELAIALNLLGKHTSHHLYEIERGNRLMQEAQKIFESVGDNFYLGHVLDDIAFSSMYSDINARIEYSEKSLAVRERSGDLFGTVGALGNLLIGHFWRGEFEKVEKYIARGFEIAEQTNDIRNIAWLSVYLAEIQQFKGNFEGAKETILRAKMISQDIIDHDLTIQVNINLAIIIAVADGEYQKARKLLENTISIDAEFSMHQPNTMLAYGIIAAGLEDVELLNRIILYPFERSDFSDLDDIGAFGMSWYSPLICITLYHNEQFERAAECVGFSLGKGEITFGYIKEWGLIQEIQAEIEQNLGEDKFKQAIERGKSMEFIDFRDYILSVG